MRKLGKLVAVASLGSMTLAGTAQATCWSPIEVEAATLRELQSRLMVASLRCAKSNHDVLPHYNAFVRNKRHLLISGNDTLKAYFGKHHGRKGGVRAYDSFAVSLANRYGAGSGDLSECESMNELAFSAASSEPSRAALVRIARENGLEPTLPGGRCGIVIASRAGG
ncbi:hypothetical protein [Parasphingorhabdus sp.]|uniref:hypothetical protein n=1 Tax=Parasphingorhabdus sp. TaxID=2709688 RepID=UPI003C70A727